MKRQRGRSRNNNHNKSQNANRAMESNGPGVKVRGAVSTIYEKYQQLARDASLSGDRVMAENYLQFAEHYYRVMRAQQEQREAREEEQAAQRAARQAQYDARKAQQQQERAAASTENAPQPTQTPPLATTQNTGEATSPAPAKDGASNHGNGTGPMDVVTPEAVPAPATTKPARTPRRRVRRPAPESKAEPKAEANIASTPDVGGETTA
ncbi:MAG: DUF4167 domain-containing protein [Robiginitomaculum sp.]|nr:DUF4167 domain-containing protein [Robiginitomaculum sp.]MDQ7076834.1 DUF4167 domain-containing protein [Robiginitomaculum sp.]